MKNKTETNKLEAFLNVFTPYKVEKNAFSFYATSLFLTNKDIRNTRKKLS